MEGPPIPTVPCWISYRDSANSIRTPSVRPLKIHSEVGSPWMRQGGCAFSCLSFIQEEKARSSMLLAGLPINEAMLLFRTPKRLAP